MEENSKNTHRRSRDLYWLLLISILPVVIGSFLYYFHGHFQFKTLNRGTLVNPPVVMHGLVSEKKWRIVYAPAHCCDKQCETTMFTLHQLRTALNKDIKRVSLVLAFDQQCKINDLHDFQTLSLEKNSYITHNKIYLVDPIGNLFMFYSGTVDPINILKDIKRVLEVSQIG